MPPICLCISCTESSFKIWQTTWTRASTAPSWSPPGVGSMSWTVWKWSRTTIRWNWHRSKTEQNKSRIWSAFLCAYDYFFPLKLPMNDVTFLGARITRIMWRQWRILGEGVSNISWRLLWMISTMWKISNLFSRPTSKKSVSTYPKHLWVLFTLCQTCCQPFATASPRPTVG